MQARTATSPDSTRRGARRNRAIAPSWDTGPDGMRRLTAECDDEITMMTFIGSAVFDESDPGGLLAGEFGAAMVAEHQRRCDACRRWARRAS